MGVLRKMRDFSLVSTFFHLAVIFSYILDRRNLKRNTFTSLDKMVLPAWLYQDSLDGFSRIFYFLKNRATFVLFSGFYSRRKIVSIILVCIFEISFRWENTNEFINVSFVCDVARDNQLDIADRHPWDASVGYFLFFFNLKIRKLACCS